MVDHELDLRGHSPPADRQPSIWHFLHDRLRGRWRYALPLSITLGLIVGGLGFFLAPTRYIATGHVEVAPFIEPVIGEDRQTMPMYDSFVESQAQMLRMDLLLDRAMRNSTARNAGVDAAFPTLSNFRDATSVRRDRRSTYISVSVEADQAGVAFAAVRAILEEYEREAAPEAKYQARRDELVQIIETQRSRLRTRRAERLDSQSRFAQYSDDVLTDLHRLNWELYTSHTLALIAAGQMVATGDSRASDAAAAAAQGQPSEPALPPAPPEPTLADLTRIDPDFAKVRQSLVQEENLLTQMLTQYSENHRPVRLQRAAVEALKARAAEMETEARRKWAAAPPTAQPVHVGRVTTVPPERTGDLLTARSAVWSDIEEIAKERRRREVIDQEIQALERGLVDLEKNLENLRYNERALKQGFTSVRMPILPDKPQRSKRNQLAAAGFIFGFGLPMGLFLLVGHVDRRAFAASQLASSSGPQDCIGVLPDLSRGEDAVETRELASACIHRLRNRIEMGRPHEGPLVLAVTSPFQGDGKTSLAFALGWSYASSGLSTCLVDCDFIGQALSAQAGQLDVRGVKELLGATTVNGEAHPVAGNPRLSVIGVGRDRSFGPEHVTRADMKRLVERLRARFDVVILDTGPLLGSVEALPIVAAADGVVLTLRRGRPRRRLDECTTELGTVGAQLIGVVLNCADLSECRRYTSASRVSARSAPAPEGEAGGAPPPATPSPMMRLLTHDAADRGER
ncbi:MAG: hypothetical protein HRU76_14760 [Phycisphaeraceae bacterium]|nr:MAG: hypothetical protein HRU76_14760 [Phycisphaeraceae bacterium]